MAAQHKTGGSILIGGPRGSLKEVAYRLAAKGIPVCPNTAQLGFWP